MNKRDKMRYLKKVVTYCIVFTSVVVLGGLFVCWHNGSDPTGIVQAAVGFFGVELGLMCLIKILEDKKGVKKNADQLETETDQP